MTSIEAISAELQAIQTQLKSYPVRITASKADGEDIYRRAIERCGSFRGEVLIQTWRFTIASNVARLRIPRPPSPPPAPDPAPPSPWLGV